MDQLASWGENYIERISKKLNVNLDYVLRGGFWIVSSSVMGTLLSLGLSIIAAKYIPKEVFGIYKYILSMAGIAGALSLSGINTVVTRSVSQGFEGVFIESLKIQSRYAIFQFLCIAAFGGYYLYQGNSLYAICFLVASICAPLSTISNTFVAFLTGKQDFKRSSLYSFISTCIYVVTFALVAILSPYLLAIVTAYFISTTLANIYFCHRTIKVYKPNTLTQEGDSRYAVHLSLSNAINIVAANIDNVIVYHLLGPVSLAIYNFATIIPDKLRSLSGFIQTIALPKLSYNTNLPKKYLWKYIWILTALALGLILVYLPLAPFVFKFFFPNYYASAEFSQLYSLTLIAIPATFIMTALSAYKMQKELYLLNISMPILRMILLGLFIFNWGIVGAIVARIASITIHFIVAGFTVRK